MGGILPRMSRSVHRRLELSATKARTKISKVFLEVSTHRQSIVRRNNVSVVTSPLASIDYLAPSLVL